MANIRYGLGLEDGAPQARGGKTGATPRGLGGRGDQLINIANVVIML